jgi:MoaD family protein
MKQPSGGASRSEDLHIAVKYMVDLRERTGAKQEELTLPAGTTLRDVLNQLNDRYDLGLPDGRTMIVVNGQGWKQLPGGLDEELVNGDRLSLFPPIMGG